MLVVPKCVGGVGGGKYSGHSVVSRSHRPLPRGHSRLHALCFFEGEDRRQLYM